MESKFCNFNTKRILKNFTYPECKRQNCCKDSNTFVFISQFKILQNNEREKHNPIRYIIQAIGFFYFCMMITTIGFSLLSRYPHFKPVLLFSISKEGNKRQNAIKNVQDIQHFTQLDFRAIYASSTKFKNNFFFNVMYRSLLFYFF